MAPKSLLAAGAVLVVALAGGCGSDDDGGGAATTTTATRQGCPVPPAVVRDVVGHPVSVERRPSGRGSCAYVGADEASAGARVEVAVRSLDVQSFDDVLADVERRAGPTSALPEGLVDGADRGWVAVAGRAVQVGAADGSRVVVVAVAEPAFGADDARDAAARLAEEALGR